MTVDGTITDAVERRENASKRTSLGRQIAVFVTTFSQLAPIGSDAPDIRS